MTTKDARENAAANAVVDHLTAVTGTTMTGSKWDDGTKDSMHDFYVEGEGHKIALEVTTIADGDRVGRDHRWRRMAPDGWVKVDGLVGCWIASQEGETEASLVISTVQTLLPELEALGITRVDARLWQEHVFSPEAHRPPEYAQLRALHQVGIVDASRVTDASKELLNEHGGEVQLARAFGTDRPADRNFPATFVNQELRETHRSDVEKLIAAEDVTARHLWMWVELTEGFSMIRSFDAEGLPSVDLDVVGIDGVWLGRSPTQDSVAGYLWLRGEGWSEFSVCRNETST